MRGWFHFYYRHPVFDNKTIKAQSRLHEIQGINGLFFAGAWTGYGFHEDGLSSALDVTHQLGSRAALTLAAE